MGTYKDSSGESIKQSIIDRKIREAKQSLFYDLLDKNFCFACGCNNRRLHFSHIISVDNCKKYGVSELAWDKSNMERECEKCHREWEDLSSKVWNHKNIKRKLMYYENNCKEHFNILITKLKND